jgi:hypothetical protein
LRTKRILRLITLLDAASARFSETVQAVLAHDVNALDGAVEAAAGDAKEAFGPGVLDLVLSELQKTEFHHKELPFFFILSFYMVKQQCFISLVQEL